VLNQDFTAEAANPRAAAEVPERQLVVNGGFGSSCTNFAQNSKTARRLLTGPFS